MTKLPFFIGTGLSIQVPSRTLRTRNFNAHIKNPNSIIPKIEAIGKKKKFEKIGKQLLNNNHMVTLGQLFKIALNLKQYVVIKHLRARKNVTSLGPYYSFGGYLSSHDYDTTSCWQKIVKDAY